MKIYFSERNKSSIAEIITTISNESFRKNKKNFTQLMHKLTDEFINLELYKGDELVKYGEELGIYNPKYNLLFKHSKGVALIRAYSFGHKKKNGFKTQIRPAISLTANKDFTGFTFDTGHFSDVSVYDSSFTGYIRFSTTDTIQDHNLYLHWVANQLEKRFTTYKFDEAYKPLYKNIFELYDITLPICYEFDEYISRNKTKRIDTLIENGVSVKDHIIKEIKYKYCNTEEDIYKCAMIYGKTYEQIKKYIDKVLD